MSCSFTSFACDSEARLVEVRAAIVVLAGWPVPASASRILTLPRALDRDLPSLYQVSCCPEYPSFDFDVDYLTLTLEGLVQLLVELEARDISMMNAFRCVCENSQTDDILLASNIILLVSMLALPITPGYHSRPIHPPNPSDHTPTSPINANIFNTSPIVIVTFARAIIEKIKSCAFALCASSEASPPSANSLNNPLKQKTHQHPPDPPPQHTSSTPSDNSKAQSPPPNSS